MLPGKREARRLVGDHMLTQQDLMGLNGEMEDAVCIGGWNLDEHPSTGFDDPEKPPFVSIALRERLQHSAPQPLQQEHRQPADGRPQHQRHAHRLYFDPRDGDLRRRRARPPAPPRRCACSKGCCRGRSFADKTQPQHRCSKRCCATIRRSRAGRTKTRTIWRAAAKSTASAEHEGTKAANASTARCAIFPASGKIAGRRLSTDGAWLELAWEQPQIDRARSSSHSTPAFSAS